MELDGSPTYVLRTLGCKANLYDSQQIETELQNRGWKPAQRAGSASLCIINSCTVTDEADRQSRKLASRLARENPGSSVVVTGCSAEVDPERLLRSAGVHYVAANREKPRLVELILDKLREEPAPAAGEVLGATAGYDELLSRHPMDREWPSPDEVFQTPFSLMAGASRSTRAFLKIQEGCNSFCTYCIIPYGRGPSRSLPPDQIVRQVEELARAGSREVIFTGTNIGDYGSDLNETVSFGGLLKRVLSETTIPRIRLSSLDPIEITPEILDLMRNESRICRHFHVSLQSPLAKILRLMKRKYSTAEVVTCLSSLAEIAAFVGMDVITGFPGETSADFEESYAMLEKLPWTRLHVFPYSERAGTPATRLPGSVEIGERVRRSRLLNELSLRRISAHYTQRLAELRLSSESIPNVLLERPIRPGAKLRELRKDGASWGVGDEWTWAPGYSQDYLRIYLASPEPLAANQLVRALPRSVTVDPSTGEAAFIATLA